MECNDNLAGFGKSPINDNNILLQLFDLFVWDFDDTIIDTRAYYTKSMKPDDIRRRTDVELIQDIPGVNYFRAFCNFLVCKGKRVSIASFGTYEIIQAYMDRIFGFNQKVFTRNNIKTIMRDCRGYPVEMYKNKNKFIGELMTFYNIHDTTRVILLDDRIENCADASIMGITAVKIQGRDENSIQGVAKYFDESVIMKVVNEFESSCSKQRLSRISKISNIPITNDYPIYDDKLLSKINFKCDRSTEFNKSNIYPIIEGFENETKSYDIKKIMVIILLIIIFIITGFLYYVKFRI
jgi:hypothetical protein